MDYHARIILKQQIRGKIDRQKLGHDIIKGSDQLWTSPNFGEPQYMTAQNCATPYLNKYDCPKLDNQQACICELMDNHTYK